MLGAFAVEDCDVTWEYLLFPVPCTKGSFGPWHVMSTAELGISFEPKDDAVGVHAVSRHGWDQRPEAHGRSLQGGYYRSYHRKRL